MELLRRVMIDPTHKKRKALLSPSANALFIGDKG
jgi:hypothetical protein